MATFEIKKRGSYKLYTEFRNFPTTFVNSLRRITISELPIVTLKNVKIINNSSQMPHEMLKHRVELLPVNVKPYETELIKNAKIQLLIEKRKDPSLITTDDFTIQDGKQHLLMRDRDLDTPLVFLKLNTDEEVHLTAELALEKGSHVCKDQTYKFHIDPMRVELARKAWIDEKKDVRIFDNFYINKYYSIDEVGRPNWIDFSFETIGILTPLEILKYSVQILKQKIDTWIESALQNITKEKDCFSIRIDGGHTIGSVLQECIYHSNNVSFVSYDIPHPLKSDMVLKFVTTKNPEEILKDVQKSIHDYCSIVESSL
jgi:DNA-directed RNA polymerase subunit L